LRRMLLVGLMLVGIGGCRRAAGSMEAGTLTSQLAVQQFVDAAKAQDLQALSAVWGNAEGPVRDRADRRQLEQRLLLMVCHLRHDESRIGPPEPGEGGRVQYRVELTQGTLKASPWFKTIKSTQSGRWFVEDFEFAATRSFCSTSRSAPPA
jgi:hypothetical protein